MLAGMDHDLLQAMSAQLLTDHRRFDELRARANYRDNLGRHVSCVPGARPLSFKFSADRGPAPCAVAYSLHPDQHRSAKLASAHLARLWPATPAADPEGPPSGR